MHPFGLFLASRDWTDRSASTDAQWRALHRRPDAPPPSAVPAPASRFSRVRLALRRVLPLGAGAGAGAGA